MKRIIFILFVLMSFCAVNAQTTYPTFLPSPKGDSALAQYGYILPKVLGHIVVGDTMIRPKYNGAERLWAHAGVDTAIWCWINTKWVKISSSGSGGGGTVVWGDITGDIANQTDLVNYIDSVVNAHGGGTTEYVVQGYGVKVDSALRVYTVRVDSTVIASKTWFYNRIDSLILTFNNTYVKYTDTASMLSHYVRRVLAGSNVTVDNTNPQYPIVSATSGGSGTVTSFSSGNLSPLFTTSVATATSTPALSFGLSTATAWRVFSSNASTTPAYNQLKAEHLNTTYSNGNMLITDGSGNLSWTTAGGSGTVTSVALAAPSIFTVTGSPVTSSGTLTFAANNATGDLIYGSGTNTLAYRTIGSTGQHLVVSGGLPVWRDTAAVPTTYVSTWSAGTTGFTPNSATSGAVTLAGVLVEANGGTHQSSYATGDMLYASGANTLSKLAIGTAAQHLVVSGGVPVWRDTAAAGGAGWSLTGNAGTTAASNFIGTTDAVSWRIRTNNALRAIVDSVGYVGINTSVPTSQLHVTGGDGVPALGSELLSSSGWTSTNWTGSFAGGWSHTTGNTTALTNTLAAVSGTGYRIFLTVTLRTAGTFTVTFGGVSSPAITPTAGTYYAEIPVVATSTGTLSITPVSTFDGTIVISIKTVTGNSTPFVLFANNTSSGLMEFRADTTGNTFIGQNAGARNLSGIGLTNLTGDNNTAYGYNALAINISGSQNNAFGSSALALNTSGYQNVAMGSALALNTTGHDNTAIGNGALGSNTTGIFNIGIGSGAGAGITTGQDNYIFANSTTNIGNANTRILIGTRGITTALATQCILIDPSATQSYSTGNNNTQVGYNVGINGGSGTDNSNFGLQAGMRNTGSGGVNIGEAAGSVAATGTSSGNFNTNLGFKTNLQATSSSTNTYSIAIGAFVQSPSTSTSGTLNIGNVLYGTNLYQTNSNSSTPTTTGSIGIGLTTPTARLMLPAGTATASTAPLKLTSGVILTTPESGVVETNSNNELYYSTSTTTDTRGFVHLGRYTASAVDVTATANMNTIDLTATGKTVTLPTAVGIQGRIYTIVLTASGTGTVATTSSQNINGSTTYSLASQYKYVTVQSTNSAWVVIANN